MEIDESCPAKSQHSTTPTCRVFAPVPLIPLRKNATGIEPATKD